MIRALLLPLLAFGFGLSLVMGSVLAQNGGTEPNDGQGGPGREECTNNTSVALEVNEPGGNQDAIDAILNCGLGEDEQAENGEGENGDGDNGEDTDGGNGNGVGINEVGTGHEACSEAAQHALDVLNELLARGEPVEGSIADIEACGTGGDGAAQPAGNGSPEGVPPETVPLGPPEGVPPEDVPQGQPQGVPPETVPLGPPEGVPAGPNVAGS